MNRLIYLVFLVLSILAFGCSSEDLNDGAIQPDQKFPDPEETVTVSLYKNTDQSIDGIFIDVNDRFISSNGWQFVSLGEMKGLGNIVSIPKDGWDYAVPARKGYGYIAYNPARPSTFYRMFVSNSAFDEMGTITGFQIRYQKPFYGFDEAMTFDKTEFYVSSDGGECTAKVTNGSIIPYRAETDCDWIDIVSDRDALHFRVENTNSLYPSTATIKVTTFYGKETSIIVSRGAMEPWEPTSSILDLKRRFWSDMPYCATEITEDIVIRGKVVSSDFAGNVYKYIVVADETAAIPVLLNRYNLCSDFPFGQEIAIRLTGLHIGNYAGYQQIGRSTVYDSDETVSYLPGESFTQYQLIGVPSDVRPVATSIENLHNALSSPSELAMWQGRYVTLADISFVEQGVALGESGISGTNRLIYDASLLQIAVRTSGYSTFCSVNTPEGVGSISGILSYYKGTWQLILNSADDIGTFDPAAVIDRPEPEPDPFGPKGDGSENSPYNVAAVLSLNNPGTTSWIEGYIVGAVDGNTIADASFSAPFEVVANILIADSPYETEIDNCVPVQLVAGMVRNNLNLRDHPENLGKVTRVCGNLERYYGRTGVRSVTTFGI